jgi:hypothetical protein
MLPLHLLLLQINKERSWRIAFLGGGSDPNMLPRNVSDPGERSVPLMPDSIKVLQRIFDLVFVGIITLTRQRALMESSVDMGYLKDLKNGKSLQCG